MRLYAGPRALRVLICAAGRLVTSLGMVGLILGAAHAAQLTVTWIDNSDNEKDFKLERKTGTTGVYTLLASVPADTSFYVDTTVTAGTTYCYRVRAHNDAGDSSNSNEACAAATNPVLQSLTVAKAGTGAGIVASSPNGINCGATCSASFASGTSVGLSATASTGSTFTGWSGACTGTGGCAVVLDAAKTVTATFAVAAQTAQTTYTVTVGKAGTGTGTVTSSPTGINCGATCSASYANGANITLAAAAAAGSTFTGWSGACTGTGPCSLSMIQARTVTATFAAAAQTAQTTYTLTVVKAGTGTGTVTSSPTGINCGTTCSASYTNGASVTLTAAAATGAFTGWSGASCSGTGTCVVSMTAARTVTATFAMQSLSLASVTADKASPQGAGTPLTFTATPTGGTAPHQCKWWLTTDAWQTYSPLRDWGTCSTPLTWIPGTAGSYQVGVWARSAGNTADAPQATKALLYTITPMTVTVNATLSSPQPINTPLTFTATPTGGTAPQQCKWWLTTDAWQTYSLLRDWQACTTALPWTPAIPGSYQVGVWTRSDGTTTDAPQASAGLPFTINPTIVSMTVTVNATPSSPRRINRAITLNATPTGGTAPQQCKWWLTTDAWQTYSLLRDWQDCSTALTWIPRTAGSYQVGVWARSAGNTADAPQATKALLYTINPW
jgi:hypothetical protein